MYFACTQHLSRRSGKTLGSGEPKMQNSDLISDRVRVTFAAKATMIVSY
jgi:hypothetical protein